MPKVTTEYVSVLELLKSHGYPYNEEGMCYGIAITAAIAIARGKFQDYLMRLGNIKSDRHSWSQENPAPLDVLAWLDNIVFYFGGALPDDYTFEINLRGEGPLTSQASLPYKIDMLNLELKGKEACLSLGAPHTKYFSKKLCDQLISFIRHSDQGVAFLIGNYNHTIALGGSKTQGIYLINHNYHHSGDLKYEQVYEALYHEAPSTHQFACIVTSLQNNTRHPCITPAFDSLKQIDLSPHRHSLLTMAFVNGHTEAIRSYASSILDDANITPEQKVELLGTTSEAQLSGLLCAFIHGRASTIRVFTSLVLQSKYLSAQHKCALLGAGNGSPNLIYALKNGYTETVMAFITQVLSSPILTSKQKKLLLTTQEKELTGLHMALYQRQAGAVKAFVTAILNSHIDLEDKLELLASKVQNKSSLWISMQKGHSVVVKSYLEAVLCSRAEVDYKKRIIKEVVISGFNYALAYKQYDLIKQCIDHIADSDLDLFQKIEILQKATRYSKEAHRHLAPYYQAASIIQNHYLRIFIRRTAPWLAEKQIELAHRHIHLYRYLLRLPLTKQQIIIALNHINLSYALINCGLTKEEITVALDNAEDLKEVLIRHGFLSGAFLSKKGIASQVLRVLIKSGEHAQAAAIGLSRLLSAGLLDETTAQHMVSTMVASKQHADVIAQGLLVTTKHTSSNAVAAPRQTISFENRIQYLKQLQEKMDKIPECNSLMPDYHQSIQDEMKVNAKKWLIEISASDENFSAQFQQMHNLSIIMLRLQLCIGPLQLSACELFDLEIEKIKQQITDLDTKFAVLENLVEHVEHVELVENHAKPIVVKYARFLFESELNDISQSTDGLEGKILRLKRLHDTVRVVEGHAECVQKRVQQLFENKLAVIGASCDQDKQHRIQQLMTLRAECYGARGILGETFGAVRGRIHKLIHLINFRHAYIDRITRACVYHSPYGTTRTAIRSEINQTSLPDVIRHVAGRRRFFNGSRSKKCLESLIEVDTSNLQRNELDNALATNRLRLSELAILLVAVKRDDSDLAVNQVALFITRCSQVCAEDNAIEHAGNCAIHVVRV